MVTVSVLVTIIGYNYLIVAKKVRQYLVLSYCGATELTNLHSEFKTFSSLLTKILMSKSNCKEISFSRIFRALSKKEIIFILKFIFLLVVWH